MMMMARVVGVLGIKGGTNPSNRQDLCGNDEMSKDSDNGDDGGSGGSVRDKRGDNAKQWRRFEQ